MLSANFTQAHAAFPSGDLPSPLMAIFTFMYNLLSSSKQMLLPQHLVQPSFAMRKNQGGRSQGKWVHFKGQQLFVIFTFPSSMGDTLYRKALATRVNSFL